MFTVITSEIRWFYKGNIPNTINVWLKNLKGEIELQPPRTDIYLNDNSTSNLGIKFREGRFEVKQKMIDLGVLDSDNISGKAEQWKKWSFDAKDEKIPLADITKGEWIKVSKKRKLKKYIISDSGKINEGFDNFQSDGCNLELTELQTYSSDESPDIYWTLGLETHGQVETLSQNLNNAFEYILKNRLPITLKIDQSYSYPKWLI